MEFDKLMGKLVWWVLILQEYDFQVVHRHGVVNLDDSETWLRVCFQRVEFFRRVMPTTFKNLAIAQHKDTLRYATIWGGGYRPSIRRFHVGYYVYLQQIALTTLDVMACHTIL
jgi:hypothetical protein